ncbi:hypothetical protein BGW41_002778 [Actinomortierella wolfii]|nr:hypothetical protein BGW41_002778 [Actinomortierella wolfii]
MGRTGKGISSKDMRSGEIISPSPEELMELYAALLRDKQDLDPRIREVLTENKFATASGGSLIDFEHLGRHLQTHHHQHPGPACACGKDHSDNSVDAMFPDDSYEDEPDDEDGDEEDEDDDEDEDDEEDDDDEIIDDDEDEEEDVADGYSHYYEEKSVTIMLREEEKRRLDTERRVREEERRLKEELRKKKELERLKLKKEKDRILLLQRLRLEDEERRKKEALERQRREKLEDEMRKKREAAEADQKARSFLFQSTSMSQVAVVKQMISSTPEESASIADAPRFATTAAIKLTGWEFATVIEGVGEVPDEKGIQETLLHVAVRVGCLELVQFFISKGSPLDALDVDGRTPLHTAAKHSTSIEICKILVEKGSHHIDKTCINSGRTALHYAAQNGYADLVSLLLEHHARLTATDVEGNTPESLAKAGLANETKAAGGNGKGGKNNNKNARIDQYQQTLQHIQKAIAAIKEAQIRKDAQLEEQRRREEELAREEAEKDRAARRKQEERLEAERRRQEEEEKELQRLKMLAAGGDSHGNQGGKKKKKKKGKGGNDSQAQPAKKESTTATTAATPAASSAPAPTASVSSGPAKSSPALSDPQTPPSVTPATAPSSSKSPIPPSAPLARTSTTGPAPTVSAPTPDLTSQSHADATQKSSLPQSAVGGTKARLPKPKTSYRPSHLVVTRLADMGFNFRDSRKALIQTEGRVEEAIDLLTSGAPLADDSEDEAQQAAEQEALNQQAARQAASIAAANGLYPQGSKTPVRLPGLQANPQLQQQQQSAHSQVMQQGLHHQQHPHVQQMHPQHMAAKAGSPGAGATSGFQQHQNGQHRVVNHPVQILQRSQPMAPHVQLRSVPTQVLQRPQMHGPTVQPGGGSQTTHRKSFNSQMPLMATSSQPPVSSVGGAVTTSVPPAASSFVAPKTVQPTPPTRAPYTYGASPASSRQPSMSGVSSAASAVSGGPMFKSPSISAAGMDPLSVYGSASTSDSLLTQKLAGMDLAGGMGNFDPASNFTGFSGGMDIGAWDSGLGGGHTMGSPAASKAGTHGNIGGVNSSGMAPSASSVSGISRQQQQHSHNPHHHNLWSTPGSSIVAPPLLQSVVMGSMGDMSSSVGSYGSPFMSSLTPIVGHHRVGDALTNTAAVLDSLQPFNEELDLGNGEGDVIKDVLAMTGIIDSDDFPGSGSGNSSGNGDNNNNAKASTSSAAAPGSNAASRVVGGGRLGASPSGSVTSPVEPSPTSGGCSFFSGYDDEGAGAGKTSPSAAGASAGSAPGGPPGLSNTAIGTKSVGGKTTGSSGTSEYSQWSSGLVLETNVVYSSSYHGQHNMHQPLSAGATSPIRGGSFSSHHHQSLSVGTTSPIRGSAFSPHHLHQQPTHHHRQSASSAFTDSLFGTGGSGGLSFGLGSAGGVGTMASTPIGPGAGRSSSMSKASGVTMAGGLGGMSGTGTGVGMDSLQAGMGANRRGSGPQSVGGAIGSSRPPGMNGSSNSHHDPSAQMQHQQGAPSSLSFLNQSAFGGH